MTLALPGTEFAPTISLYEISDTTKIQKAREQVEQHIRITNTFLYFVFGKHHSFTHFTIEPNSANTSWDPRSKKLTFGIAPYKGDDGQPAYFTSLGIVAHEIGHAFTGYIRTKRLPHIDQSRAIEESCADIFSVMAKTWHFKKISDQALWTLKERVIKDIVDCTGKICTIYRQVLRSFIPPDNASRDASDTHEEFHLNSALLNHTFYKICTETDSDIISVGQAWFQALIWLEPPYTFANFGNIILTAVERHQILKKNYFSIKDIWDSVFDTPYSI